MRWTFSSGTAVEPLLWSLFFGLSMVIWNPISGSRVTECRDAPLEPECWPGSRARSLFMMSGWSGCYFNRVWEWNAIRFSIRLRKGEEAINCVSDLTPAADFFLSLWIVLQTDKTCPTLSRARSLSLFLSQQSAVLSAWRRENKPQSSRNSCWLKTFAPQSSLSTTPNPNR